MTTWALAALLAGTWATLTYHDHLARRRLRLEDDYARGRGELYRDVAISIERVRARNIAAAREANAEAARMQDDKEDWQP